MTRLLATVSAVLLGSSGLVLLFAAGEVMQPAAAGSGAPVAGQLLGGAWLALAVATWLTRGAPQGGIYGRPIVLANLWVYTITALVCLKGFQVGMTVSMTAIVAAALAATYGYVLFRGPLEPPRRVDD